MDYGKIYRKICSKVLFSASYSSWICFWACWMSSCLNYSTYLPSVVVAVSCSNLITWSVFWQEGTCLQIIILLNNGIEKGWPKEVKSEVAQELYGLIALLFPQHNDEETAGVGAVGLLLLLLWLVSITFSKIEPNLGRVSSKVTLLTDSISSLVVKRRGSYQS